MCKGGREKDKRRRKRSKRKGRELENSYYAGVGV
jgi:hypothetical protein